MMISLFVFSLFLCSCLPHPRFLLLGTKRDDQASGVNTAEVGHGSNQPKAKAAGEPDPKGKVGKEQKEKVEKEQKENTKGESKQLNRQGSTLPEGCGWFGTIGCNRQPKYGPYVEAHNGNPGTKPRVVQGVQDGNELIRNVANGLISPSFNRPGGVNYSPNVEPFKKESNSNIRDGIYNGRTFTGSGNYEARDKDGRIILQKGVPYPGYPPLPDISNIRTRPNRPNERTFPNGPPDQRRVCKYTSSPDFWGCKQG